MWGGIRIRARPAPSQQPRSAEAILADSTFPAEHVDRIRSYARHERRQRAEYHARRYLRHLTEEELHDRVGALISNAVYVSSRNRYSTNSLHLNYWQDRLARSVEELAIRGTDATNPEGVLGHLPNLGFPIPHEVGTRSQAPVLYRYDKLRYVTALHRAGEIYLRCASSPNVTNDSARNDSNELCIRLSLLAEDLILDGEAWREVAAQAPDVVNLEIHQKTDFLMFCLSRGFDWRLFGDFSDSVATGDPQNRMACLVITDPKELSRRFRRAVSALKRPWESLASHTRVTSRSAVYYDPYDARECDTLFVDRQQLPFAKRLEYTYQQEYRFNVRPDLPDDFVPDYLPDEAPRFERRFLYLGSLEDISYVVQSEQPPPGTNRFYLSTKELTVLASAIGVTLSNAPDRVRFTYSVEVKERGRTDATDLTSAQRHESGSLQLHEQEIDVAAGPGAPNVMGMVAAFFSIFDVREHGNHLIEFRARRPNGSQVCRYRAFLACAEPADHTLEKRPLTFQVRYSVHARDGRTVAGEDTVVTEAETYWTQFNGIGPLHLHPTYRSLLVAEMEFLNRLIDRGIDGSLRYEVLNAEVGRCSEFEAA